MVDHRYRGRSARALHDCIVIDDDGLEEQLPSKFIVCPTCDGRGTHVNPAIDDEGISAEQFDDDPDFADAYFSGRYDVMCFECGGNRVVPVPDESRCSSEQIGRWRDRVDDHDNYDAELAAERMFGC